MEGLWLRPVMTAAVRLSPSRGPATSEERAFHFGGGIILKIRCSSLCKWLSRYSLGFSFFYELFLFHCFFFPSWKKQKQPLTDQRNFPVIPSTDVY